MIRTNLLTGFVVLGLILVTGCETGINEPSVDQSVLGIESPVPGTPALSISYYSPPHLRSTREDLKRVARAMNEHSQTLQQLVFDQENWQVADEATRAYLTRHEEAEVIPLLEQVAGSLMIQRIRRSEESSRERAGAVSFYTNLLVKNESSDYEAIYIALSELQEHWDQVQIRRAIRTVTEYGQAREEAKMQRAEAREKALQERYGKAESPSGVAQAKQYNATRDASGLRKIEALGERLGV